MSLYVHQKNGCTDNLKTDTIFIGKNFLTTQFCLIKISYDTCALSARPLQVEFLDADLCNKCERKNDTVVCKREN